MSPCIVLTRRYDTSSDRKEKILSMAIAKLMYANYQPHQKPIANSSCDVNHVFFCVDLIKFCWKWNCGCLNDQ